MDWQLIAAVSAVWLSTIVLLLVVWKKIIRRDE